MEYDQEQLAALGRIREGRNVFLTGPAGTGKSSVTVEAIRRRLTDRSLKVCATTGVAALNLRDKLSTLFGQHIETSTLYRWSGIGLGPREGQTFQDYLEFMRTRKTAFQGTKRRIQSTRTLIIDEISMLPGRILHLIDTLCREIRGENTPFGGIQIIAVGDFLQLPPVSKTGNYDWAFLTPTWHSLHFSNITLKQVHRQDDPEFISILNQFREGTVTTQSATILKKRVALFPKAHLLRLLTHNTQVNKWNSYQLENLHGTETTFPAQTSGPPEEIQWLHKNLSTPTHLRLKQKARVMITANLPDKQNPTALTAANGDLGTVTSWDQHTITIHLDNGRTLDVTPHTWEFDPTSQTKTGKITQFPLRLAWATTIHKSQGLTLESALIDIRATREPGQSYVAISRLRTLHGLHLKDWFTGLWISPQAKHFHRTIL